MFWRENVHLTSSSMEQWLKYFLEYCIHVINILTKWCTLVVYAQQTQTCKWCRLVSKGICSFLTKLLFLRAPDRSTETNSLMMSDLMCCCSPMMMCSLMQGLMCCCRLVMMCGLMHGLIHGLMHCCSLMIMCGLICCYRGNMNYCICK